MTEQEQRRWFQGAVDARLSALQGDPRLAARIIAQAKDAKPVRRKRWASLAFAALLLLTASTALALGLAFSPRYDAARLADEALAAQYGVTDRMMTLFSREIAEHDDGSATVTYAPVEEVLRYDGNPLGVYTVSIRRGKAEASWTLDGVDTSGGLDAKAWGAAQLEQMLTDYDTVMEHLFSHADAYRASLSAHAGETPPLSEQEYEVLSAQNRQRVEEAATLTLAEAKALASAALLSEYGFTAQQAQSLVLYDDESTYQIDAGRPTVSLFYHLSLGGEDAQKDGIYVVTVNMESGEIEDIFYDSGLAANG